MGAIASRVHYTESCRSLPADPATSIEFPTTLRIPSKTPLPTFSLIGVGVRTVSFLRVKVYSVAFYADLSNPNLKVALLLPSSLAFLYNDLRCEGPQVC